MADTFCGIDVAGTELVLATVPVHLLTTVANTEQGCAQLVAACAALTPTLIVLEASGGYQDVAVAAYLDGFELIEPTLDTVDRRLRMTIEAEMLGYRALLKKGEAVAAVATAVDRLQALLSEAQQQLAVTRLPASATFLSAFVILLREGVEAGSVNPYVVT